MRYQMIIGLAMLLGIGVLCSVFQVYDYTEYSCLECRATLQQPVIFGISFQSVEQNSYSRGFLSHDPSHTHHWRWWGSTHSYSLISVAYACGRQHPIYRLPVRVQADYARLVTPAELQKTLETIDSSDRTAAEAAVNQVFETVLNSR